MDIPKFLQHLPVWRGYPVLFTSIWVGDVPDFRGVDHDKVSQCVMEDLCGVCGRKLGEYKWFVGGPKSLEGSNLFADPPMHEVCARFSIKVCPFLSGKTTESNMARPLPAQVKENPLITSTRSPKIGIRKCKTFELVNVDGHGVMEVKRWYSKPIWLA